MSHIGEGNGTPLQYLCLENPMDGGRLQSMGSLESDTTEQLHFHFSLSCIGERNGNPVQCSCLENLRDGGAWWAAVYGVAQSWTRLKRLSPSSSRQGLPWWLRSKESTCQCRKVKSESEVAQSCPTLVTPWTAAYQAPPPMRFSWQEYWSGVPLPFPTEHTCTYKN